jgi:hypothetical protein
MHTSSIHPSVGVKLASTFQWLITVTVYHVVSNKSTMQVNRKTSYFCMQDKGPLLLRGHTRAGT